MIAKKPTAKPPLSMVEIVMRSDVATIEAALEARRKIDALLAERAAAYERIAALEKQIDEVMGAPDEFIFPPPPFPVAPFAAATAAQTTPVAKSSPAPAAAAKAEVHGSEAADEPAAHNGSASAHSPEGSSRRTGSTRSAAAQN